jgi:hypothetical protein
MILRFRVEEETGERVIVTDQLLYDPSRHSNIMFPLSGKDIVFDTCVGIRNVNREIPLSVERLAFPQSCIGTNHSDSVLSASQHRIKDTSMRLDSSTYRFPLPEEQALPGSRMRSVPPL